MKITFFSILLALVCQEAQAQYFPTTDTTWQTTSAANAGANAALLADAVTYARQANSNALVILHGGRILAESYFGGWSRNTKYRLNSATKPMVAALVGKLVSTGTFTSLAQKSSNFIPEWRNVTGKKDITLRHHLTMTTGLEGGENNLLLGALAASERFFAVNLPLTHMPGTYWTYNNPAYRLLFSILQTASGDSLSNLFSQYLSTPLGMNASWVIRRGMGVQKFLKAWPRAGSGRRPCDPIPLRRTKTFATSG
jgi:CubicO group peptidase (beta-lactamase class C family)